MEAGLRSLRHALSNRGARVVVSITALALVTGAIYVLQTVAPVLSLGVLYVFAVLPVAIVGGLPYALPVAIASMLAFNWLFLPPKYTFELRESENWVVLAVYLVTAVVVSELAARSRRRAAEAEQRAREAALLAEVAGVLLETSSVQAELPGIQTRVAPALGATGATIELGSARPAAPHESVYDLRAGDRLVGLLFLTGGASPSVTPRVLRALASLLAVALDRERLARTALEAEALRRSDEAKTALLRAVSHDLRSPLTAIRAATDGLSTASLTLDEGDRAALLATIDAEAKRLERLVANLLDLSRLEAGAASPRREVWTLEDLVGRALGDLGVAAERVTVSLAEALPPIRVDATQIERVLANLLENALKFSSPSDPVRLSADRGDDAVLVRIVDLGPGVDADDRERLFEPFERGAAGGARPGAGLGLAIARGFARANDASVWAEPAHPRGTCFVVSLPVAAAARVRG